MIGTKVLVSAIGLTVLFAHVEADEKVTGSIRGEEGRELEGYYDEGYEVDKYYKDTKSKKSKKSGSKGDKGGRCEASKSKKSSKKDWYWYGPPKDDSKICKVFSFLDDHHHNHHGGGYGGNRQLQYADRNGECFDVEDYCHLIDHLHPDFNDMVCPCPYEEITYPWMKEGGYKSYKTEMVCPKDSGYGRRELVIKQRYNDINRYGKFCSKALGFPYKPVKEGYGVVEANYRYDDDDGDCYDGCKKYVEYCCCKFGDSGKHYY